MTKGGGGGVGLRLLGRGRVLVDILKYGLVVKKEEDCEREGGLLVFEGGTIGGKGE